MHLWLQVILTDMIYILFYSSGAIFLAKDLNQNPMMCKYFNFIDASLFCLPWLIFLGNYFPNWTYIWLPQVSTLTVSLPYVCLSNGASWNRSKMWRRWYCSGASWASSRLLPYFLTQRFKMSSKNVTARFPTKREIMFISTTPLFRLSGCGGSS